MKELYIYPELNVVCFAPMERLANDDLNVELLLDVSTYGAAKPSAGFDDGDFGLDII